MRKARTATSGGRARALRTARAVIGCAKGQELVVAPDVQDRAREPAALADGTGDHPVVGEPEHDVLRDGRHGSSRGAGSLYSSPALVPRRAKSGGGWRGRS